MNNRIEGVFTLEDIGNAQTNTIAIVSGLYCSCSCPCPFNLKLRAQDRLQVAINLHRHELRPGSKQSYRKSPGTWPNLKHKIARRKVSGCDDLRHLVAIVQEILPEAMPGVQAVGCQE